MTKRHSCRRSHDDRSDEAAVGVRIAARLSTVVVATDVIAGLTVWAVLVPESLAYATIAGVSPVVDCCNDVGRRLAVQGARSLSTRDR